MTYQPSPGHARPVHDHPSNQTCHWYPVFKPLAFSIFLDADLMCVFTASEYFDAQWQYHDGDVAGYAMWLCKQGKNGILNLLNVFLFIHSHIGPPTLPVLPCQ